MFRGLKRDLDVAGILFGKRRKANAHRQHERTVRRATDSESLAEQCLHETGIAASNQKKGEDDRGDRNSTAGFEVPSDATSKQSEEEDLAKDAGFQIQEISVIRKAFKLFDSDSSGLISTSELHQILEELGEVSTLEECSQMMEKFDLDGDGTIDFKEFVYLIVGLLAIQDSEDDVIEAFQVFDKEESGFINSSELRRVMTNLGDKLSNLEVDEMIRCSDIDGDGQVNYEEFTKVMMKTK